MKTFQTFNMPGIFPPGLESLVIRKKDENDGHLEVLQADMLPHSLKDLETNYLFENHPIGVNVLPSSLETLKFHTTYDNGHTHDFIYNFSVLYWCITIFLVGISIERMF